MLHALFHAFRGGFFVLGVKKVEQYEISTLGFFGLAAQNVARALTHEGHFGARREFEYAGRNERVDVLEALADMTEFSGGLIGLFLDFLGFGFAFGQRG